MIDVQLLNAPVQLRPIEPLPQPAGAECVFLGRTRVEHHPEHGRLMKLTYQAHEPLAVRCLHDLAQQAIDRYRCLAVRIHHAIGDVPPGEASVMIQTVCGHRKEAFDACRYLIDALKQTAPIWKQEVWEDGTTWSEGAAAQPHLLSEPSNNA